MTTNTPAPAQEAVLTDLELLDIGAKHGRPSVALLPMWRAVEAAVLSKLRAPVADSTLPLEKALYELVNKIDTGLDSGDLVQDARRASTVLDAIMTGGDLVACAHTFFKECGEDKWRDRYERSLDFRLGWNACLDAIDEARAKRAALASAPVAGEAKPVCWIEKDVLEGVRDEGSDAWVYWRPAGHVAEPDEMPLYAAPQASEAVRVQQLEAARIAYAREFPPDENGDPDVGNIHANIRKLKSQLTALSAQRVAGKSPAGRKRTSAERRAPMVERVYGAPLATQPAEKPANSATSTASGPRQESVSGLPNSGISHTDGGAVYE